MSFRGWLVLVGAPLCVLAAVVVAAAYSTTLAAWIGGGWIGLGVILWIVAELWLWRDRRRSRASSLPRARVRS